MVHPFGMVRFCERTAMQLFVGLSEGRFLVGIVLCLRDVRNVNLHVNSGVQH